MVNNEPETGQADQHDIYVYILVYSGCCVQSAFAKRQMPTIVTTGLPCEFIEWHGASSPDHLPRIARIILQFGRRVIHHDAKG